MGTGLLVLLLAAAPGRTQSSSSPDTLAKSTESWDREIRETLISLDLLRLDQWLLRHPDADTALVAEVRSLRELASQYARKGDLASAEAYLETGWEMVKAFPADDSNEPQPAPQPTLNGDTFAPKSDSPQRFTWSRELLFGSDLWRQSFDLSFAVSDTNFTDNSTNPFVGLRLNFDAGEWRRGWQGYALFKYSRDYVSGEADFQVRRPLGHLGSWSLENRFEGTRYRPEALGLRYLQNQTGFAADLQPGRVVELHLRDDFRVRKYGDESEIYPSYLENTARVFSYLLLGGWRWGFGGRFQNRYHPTFLRNDYNEWRWDTNLYRGFAGGSSFFVELQGRRRDYFNTTARDSTFLQTYNETSFEGIWRINFGAFWGMRARTFGAVRRYDSFSPFALDYVDLEARPELVFRLTPTLSLGFGFFYGWRDYQEPRSVRMLAALPQVMDYSISFEDYRTLGPSISLEILRFDNLVLNLTETYQWRRYPNSPATSVRNFTLYSNRNINSLLLFLSWNVTPGWQFSVVANFDDDRGEEVDKGSTQSTLLSLELTYGF